MVFLCTDSLCCQDMKNYGCDEVEKKKKIEIKFFFFKVECLNIYTKNDFILFKKKKTLI